MSIRGIRTMENCSDLASRFGEWVEKFHPEVVWARDIEPKYFVAWLQERWADGCTLNTIATYLRRWKKIVRRMAWRGWCRADDLLQGLDQLPLSGAQALGARRRGGGYSAAEVQGLIAAAEAHDHEVAVAMRVLAGTGMRAAELLTMDVAQVRQLATRGRCSLRRGQAKGGRIRRVYATADARAACAEAVARGWERPFAFRRTVAGSRRFIYGVIRSCAEDLGIRSRGLHGFRTFHLRCVYTAERLRGRSALWARRRVSTLAGHRRIGVTYAYTVPGPGEPVAPSPVPVPPHWAGREQDLRVVCAVAVWCAGVLGEDLPAVVARDRLWLQDAVRAGYLRGARIRPLRVDETAQLRDVLVRTAGTRYPFRLYCRTVNQAARLVEAVVKGHGLPLPGAPAVSSPSGPSTPGTSARRCSSADEARNPTSTSSSAPRKVAAR